MQGLALMLTVPQCCLNAFTNPAERRQKRAHVASKQARILASEVRTHPRSIENLL